MYKPCTGKTIHSDLHHDGCSHSLIKLICYSKPVAIVEGVHWAIPPPQGRLLQMGWVITLSCGCRTAQWTYITITALTITRQERLTAVLVIKDRWRYRPIILSLHEIMSGIIAHKKASVWWAKWFSLRKQRAREDGEQARADDRDWAHVGVWLTRLSEYEESQWTQTSVLLRATKGYRVIEVSLLKSKIISILLVPHATHNVGFIFAKDQYRPSSC